MNPQSKKQMESELAKAANVAQSFDILKKYYDLENCKPTAMMRTIAIGQIQKGLTVLGAKPKQIYK